MTRNIKNNNGPIFENCSADNNGGPGFAVNNRTYKAGIATGVIGTIIAEFVVAVLIKNFLS